MTIPKTCHIEACGRTDGRVMRRAANNLDDPSWYWLAQNGLMFKFKADVATSHLDWKSENIKMANRTLSTDLNVHAALKTLKCRRSALKRGPPGSQGPGVTKVPARSGFRSGESTLHRDPSLLGPSGSLFNSLSALLALLGASGRHPGISLSYEL